MKDISRYILHFRKNGCKDIHALALLLFFFTLFMFVSCIDEHVEGVGNSLYGEEVTFTVSPGFKGLDLRAYDDGVNGAPEDVVIKEIRVLMFDTSGEIAYNRHIPDMSLYPDTFGLKAKKGTYDFVFIANEGSDTSMTAALDAFTGSKTITDLESIAFASSAFDSAKEIPMATLIKQVTLVADEEYEIEGVSQTGTWEVALTRLAIRLDIKIYTESIPNIIAFEKLEISNYPKSVPILENKISDNSPIYYGGTSNTTPQQVYTILKSQGEGGDFQPVSKRTALRGEAGISLPGDENSNPGGVGGGGPPTAGEWTVSRIILPSSIFTPNNEGNAIKMKVVYSDTDRQDVTVSLKGNDTDEYQAPRNNYYVIDGTLTMDALEVYIGVEDWDMMLMDTNIYGQELNVSTIAASVNEHNMARVYFWSDHPEVTLDEQTSDGENVDDIFYGLAGSNPENFHYNYNTTTREGSGYFDIMTDRVKLPGLIGDSQTYKIYLNAGGLKREITVDVTIHSTFAAYNYVGAFWRNNQTGERVIAAANTGDWTATVQDNWIIMAEGKSLDSKLWTDDEPSDAENYPVEGNKTSINGTGNIFFRIGLTSYNAGSPRYSVVTVTKGDGSSFPIYIRQGEEADYVMRPQDSGANLPLSDGAYRPNAGKFSPYNLTSQEYLDGVKTGGKSLSGHSQISVRGGVFTKYPSQAGALFQWANESATHIRIAWHPTNPSSTYASMWSIATPVEYWSKLKDEHEICPPGYRRPHEGPINKDVENTTIEEIAKTEMRTSLWLNPQTGSSTNNMDNSLFGYYADGFFDRRIIVGSQNVSTSNANTTVSITNSDVAYIGRLFYNPSSNASLFLPMTGYRSAANAGLYGAGNTAYYKTATTLGLSTSNNYTWQTILGPTYARMSNNPKEDATPIRCVVGEWDSGPDYSHLMWTYIDRVFADEDIYPYDIWEKDIHHMSWAEAMGVSTYYNTNLMGINKYSDSEEYDNVGYEEEIPRTDKGCGGYYQGDDPEDPIIGRGCWMLPETDEIFYGREYLDRRVLITNSTLGGYLTSSEWITGQLAGVQVGDITSVTNMRRKTFTPEDGRKYLIRCVRKPTEEELIWRLNHK